MHIGSAIFNELKRQDRTVAWFARQIHCTRPHAYRIFKKDNLDLQLLKTISKVLEHDFFKDLSDDMQ